MTDSTTTAGTCPFCGELWVEGHLCAPLPLEYLPDKPTDSDCILERLDAIEAKLDRIVGPLETLLGVVESTLKS